MEVRLELLHVDVELASKLAGVVTGVHKDLSSGAVKYLVEYWDKSGAKREDWYPESDFTVLRETDQDTVDETSQE